MTPAAFGQLCDVFSQLLQVFSYRGTLFARPPGGTILLRRLYL